MVIIKGDGMACLSLLITVLLVLVCPLNGMEVADVAITGPSKDEVEMDWHVRWTIEGVSGPYPGELHTFLGSDGGRLIIQSGAFVLGLSVDDGEVVWRIPRKAVMLSQDDVNFSQGVLLGENKFVLPVYAARKAWLLLVDVESGAVDRRVNVYTESNGENSIDRWIHKPVSGSGYVGLFDSRNFLYVYDGHLHARLGRYAVETALGYHPVVSNGVIYWGGELLCGRRLEDGSEVFCLVSDEDKYSSPTVVGDALYASYADVVAKYDATNGSVVWEDKTSSSALNVQTSIVCGHSHVFSVGLRPDALYAHDAASGRLSWSLDSSTKLHGAPVVFEDNYLLQADENGKLRALSTVDGAQLWELSFSGLWAGAYNTTPLVVDDMGAIYYVFGTQVVSIKVDKGRLARTGYPMQDADRFRSGHSLSLEE